MNHTAIMIRTVVITVGLGIFVACSPAIARGQSCDGLLVRRAQEHFDLGRFEEAKAGLRTCLATGFSSESDREIAFRVMALTYVAQDSTEQARYWVRQLVNTNTRYRADPQTDPPVFASMVDDARPPAISWLWKGSRPIQWVGRGALLGLAVALPVLLWPEGPPVPLPGPPALPAN